MMHVLLVSPHLPPAHVGGVEVYSQYLLRAFRARGHRVQGAAVEHVTSGVDACTARHRRRRGLPDASADPVAAAVASVPAAGRPSGGRGLVRAAARRDRRPTSCTCRAGTCSARRRWPPRGGPASRSCSRSTTTGSRARGSPCAIPSGEICSGPERPSKCAWCLTADQRRYQLLDRLSGGAMTRGQDRSRLWQLAIGGPVEAVVHRQHELADLLRVRRGGPGADALRRRAGGRRHRLSARGDSPQPLRHAADRAGPAHARRDAAARLHRTTGPAQGRAPGRRRRPRPARSADHARRLRAAHAVSRSTWRACARWRRRSAHHLPRALPARGAARRVRGHRRRGRALGVARGGGDRHSGSAGGGLAGDRLHARGVAGTRSATAWTACSSIPADPDAPHAPARPGCSTSRACAPRSTPPPRSRGPSTTRWTR